MDGEQAKAKLLAVEKELGHAVRLFTNTASSANPDEISSSSTEEPDEFYEFTPDDYYRIMSDRIGDLESDNSKEGPYLRDDLNGLDLPIDQVDPVHPEEEPKGASPVPDPKPPAKKPAKPKWLKL